MNDAIAPEFDSTHRADILVVDDTVENLHLLASIFSVEGYSVRKALSGQMALAAVQAAPPDLILLDILMPGLDGYEVCRRLKADAATANIPVIFLSALNEPFNKVKAFEVGGIDYITKPFQLAEVLVRTRNQLLLQSAERAMRQLNATLEERVRERTRQLELANAQLISVAFHDALTGLPNRALFMECLEQALSFASTDPAYQFAVLFLDCDRFKRINDSFGHLAGDELLIAIGRRLSSCLGEVDTLARFGGDEFAILLPQLNGLTSATRLAENLLKALSDPFLIQQGEVVISTSIGIVLSHPDQHQKPEHLLRDADTAMYCAKARGRGRYEIFTPVMHSATVALPHLETDLRRAIQAAEFVLYYQPIVCLKTGVITGVEALVHWRHPQRGVLQPEAFLPLAEETEVIVAIEQWALEAACYQLQCWQAQRQVEQNFSISINLSVRQLPKLIGQVGALLAATQLQPHHLNLEIAERGGLHPSTGVVEDLRQRQLYLTIDNFGSGCTALRDLQALPIKSLKIARSLIQDDCLQSHRLVSAVLGIARAMEMTVIAEGIETAEQLAHLKAIGCDFGQGSVFSSPLPAGRLAGFINSNL